MKFLNSSRNIRHGHSARNGVTIVEVLTSIIVAVIGVAGVLVLIPFGIRQAQTGLDLQDSASVAENASHEFAIRGFSRVGRYEGQDALPWIEVHRTGPLSLLPAPGPNPGEDFGLVTLNSPSIEDVGSMNYAGWYLIDPLWLSSAVDSSDTDNSYPHLEVVESMFNYVGTIPADNDLFRFGIPADDLPPIFPRYVHLLNLVNPFVSRDGDPPIANPLTLGTAARLFQSRDDLQFAVERDPVSGAEIDEFSPPISYLDRDAGGTGLRRQYSGDISWSAVAVPKRKTGDVNLLAADDNSLRTEGFDFFVIVYKDRSFESPVPYALGAPGTNADRDPRFLFTALDEAANPNQIFGTSTVTLDVLPDAIDIRNDSWVMLVNYDLNRQAQVGFYRVIGSVPEERIITLDGSDFTIYDELPDGTANRSKTFAIYLPGVVNVFKRQLNLEPDSNLNQF